MCHAGGKVSYKMKSGATKDGRLKVIEAKLGELDGIDHQRVADLRAKIEAGEYEIDSKQIAESLLALESKLYS